MKHLSFIVVPAITILISVNANAALPPNCHERFESELNRRVGTIREALVQKGGYAENRMMNLRTSVTETLSYIQGQWASDCAKAAPENGNKLDAIIARVAQKPVDEAKIAYQGACRDRAEELIQEHRGHISRGENSGSNQAQAQWDSLLTAVRNLKCQGMDTQIAELEKEKALASSRYQKSDAVDLAGRVCPSVVRELNAANTALAGGATSTEEAPAVIAQGSSDFKNLVLSCKDALKQLRASGLKDSDEAYRIEPPQGLPSDVKMSVVAAKMSEVESILSKNQDLDALAVRSKAHNTRIQTEVREKWIKENVLSGDQKQVFETHRKLIPRQKKIPGKTVWTYWSKLTTRYWADCEEYTFDATGKMTGERKYLCN